MSVFITGSGLIYPEIVDSVDRLTESLEELDALQEKVQIYAKVVESELLGSLAMNQELPLKGAPGSRFFEIRDEIREKTSRYL